MSMILSVVATVLTVYGIETGQLRNHLDLMLVATVLTIYGIETHHCGDPASIVCCNSTYRLRY